MWLYLLLSVWYFVPGCVRAWATCPVFHAAGSYRSWPTVTSQCNGGWFRNDTWTHSGRVQGFYLL